MEKTLSLETLSRDAYSGHELRKNYIITDAATWKDIWAETLSDHPQMPEVPGVDFSTEMVLAVYMGRKTSGGYSTTIERVVETDDKLEVFVKETRPGRGMMTTMALTNPYHAVKIQKSDKKVEFKYY